jgi:hypothetical protein
VVFGGVLVDDDVDDEVVVLLDVAADCVAGGGVVVTVEVWTVEFWEPAASTGSGCGDPQALSTAVAAIAAPMISLRTCIPGSLSCVILLPLKTVRYSPRLRCVRYRPDLGRITSSVG